MNQILNFKNKQKEKLLDFYKVFNRELFRETQNMRLSRSWKAYNKS